MFDTESRKGKSRVGFLFLRASKEHQNGRIKIIKKPLWGLTEKYPRPSQPFNLILIGCPSWMKSELFTKSISTNEAAPPPLANARHPAKKFSLYFWFCARPIFSEKRKGCFSFGVLPVKFQAVCRGYADGLRTKNESVRWVKVIDGN